MPQPQERVQVPDEVVQEFAQRLWAMRRSGVTTEALPEWEALPEELRRQKCILAAKFIQLSLLPSIEAAVRKRVEEESRANDNAIANFIEAIYFEAGCMRHYAEEKPGMLGKLAGEMVEPIEQAIDALNATRKEDGDPEPERTEYRVVGTTGDWVWETPPYRTLRRVKAALAHESPQSSDLRIQKRTVIKTPWKDVEQGEEGR